MIPIFVNPDGLEDDVMELSSLPVVEFTQKLEIQIRRIKVKNVLKARSIKRQYLYLNSFLLVLAKKDFQESIEYF